MTWGFPTSSRLGMTTRASALRLSASPLSLTYIVQRNLRTAIKRTTYEYVTPTLMGDGTIVR